MWNKSNREHTIIQSKPDDVRAEADAAVRDLGWDGAYYVDADHIGLKTVDAFLAASNFYTLDVADFTGIKASSETVERYVTAMRKYSTLAFLAARWRERWSKGLVPGGWLAIRPNSCEVANFASARCQRMVQADKEHNSFAVHLRSDCLFGTWPCILPATTLKAASTVAWEFWQPRTVSERRRRFP